VKVLICGDRNWDHHLIMKTLISGLYSMYLNDLYIIQGEAKGADSMARDIGTTFVREKNILSFPAEWDKYGKGAGPIRNKQMLDEGPDLVIAFHSDIENSKGTKNMVDQAWSKGVPVYVISKYS